MFAFKILSFLWPFIKEMILGDKTLAESIKTNKKKVLLILLIFASLGLNLFSIPRLFNIGKEYLALDKKYKTTLTQMEDINKKVTICNDTVEKLQIKLKDKPKNVVVSDSITDRQIDSDPPAPVNPSRKKNHLKISPAENRVNRLFNDFDNIKKREEKNK